MAGGDLADIGPACHQVVGAGPQPAGDHQPAQHPPILPRRGALGVEGQRRPSLDPDPGQERPGIRCRRVTGEHPGGDEIGMIGGDGILDVEPVGNRLAHPGTAVLAGSAWASIASAARRYSFSSQSLARCR